MHVLDAEYKSKSIQIHIIISSDYPHFDRFIDIFRDITGLDQVLLVLLIMSKRSREGTAIIGLFLPWLINMIAFIVFRFITYFKDITDRTITTVNGFSIVLLLVS